MRSEVRDLAPLGAAANDRVTVLRPSGCTCAAEALESSDDNAKIQALQRAITLLLSGEQLPTLFITIVRYVLPSENHVVQKLLLLYLVSWAGAGSSRRVALLWAVAAVASRWLTCRL